jgi:DNA relaxase NicK
LHYKLYNAKELFCQYIYECLASPVIKPYLPPEVLTLVSDMQYYSLSYKEACRRFRFCVERGLMLYKKERTWVDFVELVKIIETALQKAIKDYHGFKGIAKEKLLKAILTDEEGIHIPEKVFLYEIEARPVS